MVGIERIEPDMLLAHGILDDHIYSIWLDVSISIPDLEIRTIEGDWNRWTTPECPRAISFLQEAVGLRIEEEGFSHKVHKIVGRKACRHFANLLLECSHTAKEAFMVVKWEEARTGNGELTFEDYARRGLKESKKIVPTADPSDQEPSPRKEHHTEQSTHKKISGGMVIDLHVHTSPASPCSAASVELLIEEAKRIGLDAICLTDHNYVWDKAVVEDLRKRHGFLIFRGNEITTDQGDVVVFGLEKDIKGIIKLEELRQEVIRAGGFMIVAHPFRGFLTFNVGQLGLTPEKAMERSLFKQVDAVEVLNSKVTEQENSFASEVAAGLSLPTTGGSDAHEVTEVGIYATRFAEAITNEKDLVEALKGKNYSPVAFRREKGVL